jgi:hypothetical protein
MAAMVARVRSPSDGGAGRRYRRGTWRAALRVGQRAETVDRVSGEIEAERFLLLAIRSAIVQSGAWTGRKGTTLAGPSPNRPPCPLVRSSAALLATARMVSAAA